MKNLYIFDCFGVVVSDVSTIFMNNRRFSDEQTQYMRKQIFRNVDIGVMTMEQMFEKTSEHFCFDKTKMIEEWKSCECVLEDTVKLIKNIKEEGHCVALLSNAAVDYVDYLFDKFNINDLFDYKFVSSNYGCAKPDKEFYKLCVDSFTEKFDAIYFTDDNPANLVGLEQFGITPVLFVNAQDFISKVGLKIKLS